VRPRPFRADRGADHRQADRGNGGRPPAVAGPGAVPRHALFLTDTVPARRQLFAALGACAFLGAGTPRWAQRFPVRPVRIIVPLTPGGPVDVVARVFAGRLTDQLGQQFIVDNRPGAGGSIGGELVARAPADGYTLLVAAGGTLAISPHLVRQPFDV